jgi:hypothetical protein
VGSEVFRSPPPSDEEVAEYAGGLEKLRRRELGESPGEEVSLRFVATWNPVPEREGNDARSIVAAAGAQVVGETLRLWGAATREAFRGRGAYGALVLKGAGLGGSSARPSPWPRQTLQPPLPYSSVRVSAGLAPNVALCWRYADSERERLRAPRTGREEIRARADIEPIGVAPGPLR